MFIFLTKVVIPLCFKCNSGWGGPNVTCQILKTSLSHVIVGKNMALSTIDYQKLLCRMSLMIFSPMSHIKFKESPHPLSLRGVCCMPNSRKAPVAVSIVFQKWLCRHVEFGGVDPFKC